MNKPYEYLTLCLSEVKKSNLPPIKKLQIEVQLYQLKRLVIMTDQASATSCAPCEIDFTSLYDRVKDVCNPDAEPGEANELVKHMMAMKQFPGFQTATQQVSSHRTPEPEAS